MNCENLIVITGISCQGKTYIAMELQRECGFYVIHTDTFYHPIGRQGLTCVVGEECQEKNRQIREHKPLLTKTTIIEGSHIGNKQELEIFVRELDFWGKVFIFRVESPNLEEQFKSKHKEEGEWEHISSWFKKIYNLKDVIVIEDAKQIINFLEIYNGNICLSGQS